MTDDQKKLTKPQREALEIFAAADNKDPGSWHKPLVLAKRSRNAWRLLELGLVERRDVVDKTGKTFAYEYRINSTGRELLKGSSK